MKKEKSKLEEDFNYKNFEAEAIAGLNKGQPLIGEGGILTKLMQRIINAALEGEVKVKISEDVNKGLSNKRNGYTRKKVKTSLGEVEVSPPRDREGEFEPKIVEKWSRELGGGLDNQILSMYASGNSITDIQKHVKEIYGVNYSSGAISAITEEIWQSVVSWQQRELDPVYVVVYLDAIHFKIRQEGQVETNAIYTVYGVSVEGERDVLGLYIGESEGARNWGRVLEDIKRRGVQDVLIFCIDGLTGFSETIEHIYPNSNIQRCIVHMIRTSLQFVADKDRLAVCQGLRQIYQAMDTKQAEVGLLAFKENWDKKYPEISRKWQENWTELTHFMDYCPEIRRMIYTTNAVEALHRQMRKVTKTKGAWMNEKGLLKLLYLALIYKGNGWNKKVPSWIKIQRELMVTFGKRYTDWIVN